MVSHVSLFSLIYFFVDILFPHQKQFAIWDYELKSNFQYFCVLSLKKSCLWFCYFIRPSTPIIDCPFDFNFTKAVFNCYQHTDITCVKFRRHCSKWESWWESKISTTFFIPNSRLNLSTSDSVCWSQETVLWTPFSVPSSAIFLLFQKLEVFIISDGQNVCLSRFRLWNISSLCSIFSR